MIDLAVWLIASLFVLVPSVLGLSAQRKYSRTSRHLGWVLTSTALRFAIALTAVWLYHGGGVFDRVVKRSPPIVVTALVDTSSSLVSELGAVSAFGANAADRIEEALAAMGLSPQSVGVILFDEAVRPLAGGLIGLRELSAADLGAEGQSITRLREALVAVPTSAPGAGYTLLISDGWVGGANQSSKTELLRAAAALGQPIISLPLAPQEAWRYEDPAQARLVALEPMPASRFIAGGDTQRGISFAIGSPASMQEARTVDLTFLVQGREELITQYACRDTELRGVGRVTIPYEAGGLIPCLPLTTFADPPGASAQSVLGIGVDKAASAAGTGTNGEAPHPDRAVVQFLERGHVPHLLVLDGASSEQTVPAIIDASLRNLGWTWERTNPQQWANAANSDQGIDLDAYDAVLIVDFAPGNFGVQPETIKDEWSEELAARQVDQALEQLASYVANGGGLFMSGGEESFGVGGYASTQIEPLLPVQLDPKGAAGDPPIAVVGVLDVSASLWYQKETFDRAKDYLIGSLQQLPEGSQVRILGYSDEPHELVPLQAFDTIDNLARLLDEALEDLSKEFERRRLLGLQPEGLDVFGALAAGYRTFDRMAQLEAEQAFRAGAGEIDDVAMSVDSTIEKRLFLITDAEDADLLTFKRWTVDETGTFIRNTAFDLARQRFEEQGVVLNSIGMTYGENALPPLDMVFQSGNRQWLERYQRGAQIGAELQRLSGSGGGTTYLDSVEIPLGSVSRQMRTYIADGINVSPSVNHRFLPTEILEQGGGSVVVGAAIAPGKSNAREILFGTHQPEAGQAVRLGVWTEWVTEAQNIEDVLLNRQAERTSISENAERADFDANAATSLSETRARLSFGGAVSVLTTSLRSEATTQSAFSSWPLHQVAFVRMLDWLVRTHPRDSFQFGAYRVEKTSAQEAGVTVELDISSIGEFDVQDASLALWRMDEADIRALPSVDVLSDGLPADLSAYGEPGAKLVPQISIVERGGSRQTKTALRTFVPQSDLDASLNSAGAVLVDIHVEGIGEQGQTRNLQYRVFVLPNQLQFKAEPASWIQGLNEPLLQNLAVFSKGAFFSPGEDIALRPALAPEAMESVIRIDYRWLLVLLMILAFIADFIIREYRVGRE